MLIEGSFPVNAAPQALLTRLFDPALIAACLPGCEAVERIDDDRYRTVVVVGLAGVRARFDLQVQIIERNEQGISTVTRGEEGGNASTLHAESTIMLSPAAAGTLLQYRSEVNVAGRLGRFALGMMKKKAQAMGDEFAANLGRRLNSPDAGQRTAPLVPAADPAASPASAPPETEQPAPAAADPHPVRSGT